MFVQLTAFMLRKKKMNEKIYLDNSATTYADPRVKREIDSYFTDNYGNPGSFNTFGFKAKEAVDDSREKISKILHCNPDEIIFSGSGTESNNLAIKGVARELKLKQGKNHIVTTKVEHPSVLETCKYLEKYEGFDVTYLGVDKYGLISGEQVKDAITDKTALVTVIYGNNEIGSINPIAVIGKITREKKVYFHTDACQAAGSLNVNVNDLNVDLMTLNGSKIYGPKGIGVLYVRKGTRIQPIIHGGGQENNLRSGTENVPGIVGFARALEICQDIRDSEVERLTLLREKLIKNVLQKVDNVRLNGHPIKRLPFNVSFSFKDIEAESLILLLDENGICVSAGSACSSKSLDPSYVVLNLCVSKNYARGTIRISLGRSTTEKDIDKVIEVLPKLVSQIRSMNVVSKNGKTRN